jgi:hypothetical protein
MKANVELETWRRLWHEQSSRPVSADLRDRVARETRLKKLGLIGSTSVTVLIGGWITLRAISSARPEDVALAVETWLFIAVVWTGALWIDRGTWRPLAQTTTAFVDLSIRRCESTLSALRFGLFLYIGQLAILLAWQSRYSSMAPAALWTSWPVVLLGWIGAPAVCAFAIWYTRRKKSELAQLLAMRRQLSE